MAKKNNTSIAPWILFLLSVALLSGGWLMRPFPLLIFLGFAPLFAIVDQTKQEHSFWTNIEFILLALFVSFFAANGFEVDSVIQAIVQAIVFAMAFLGYTFAHQQLGERLGKFTILFFWIGLEYLLLKLPWRSNSIFLAEVMSSHPSWIRWTLHTGFLGITLWILIVNLLAYFSLFRSGFNIYWLVATGITLIAPVAYSYYYLKTNGINHEQMIALFSSTTETTGLYGKHGELVSRTGSWISVVILLLSLVKIQTKKK
jgi:apolipoprotein N-acyltransferase